MNTKHINDRLQEAAAEEEATDGNEVNRAIRDANAQLRRMGVGSRDIIVAMAEELQRMTEGEPMPTRAALNVIRLIAEGERMRSDAAEETIKMRHAVVSEIVNLAARPVLEID